MNTTMIGAEKFYTTENNAARRETVEQARDLDQKILDAWVCIISIRYISSNNLFHIYK